MKAGSNANLSTIIANITIGSVADTDFKNYWDENLSLEEIADPDSIVFFKCPIVPM